MQTPIRDFIFQSMENHYKTCECDRYGQMSIFTTRGVFKERKNEAVEYIKENKMIQIAKYGGRLGIYEGINPWGGIKDKELENVCKKAFELNPNKRSRTQYQW